MASTLNDTHSEPFVDRRSPAREGIAGVGYERRQFTNSYEGLSDGARELALALDEYKLRHRRRFVTHEEIYHVVRALGYSKDGT